MSRNQVGSSTIRLPDEIAEVLKQRELAARAKHRGIGILGAGPAGKSLATRFAELGVTVTLIDDKLARAQDALHRIAASLNQRIDGEGVSTAPQGALLQRIQIGSGIERLRGQDLVIETIGLDNVERKVHAESLQQLEGIVERGTPIASVVNDARQAEELAVLAPDPSRVVPIHIMLPEFRLSVLQVVSAPQVSRDSLVKATRLLTSFNLSVIGTPTRPCFVVDRLFVALVNEACLMLEQGQSDIEEIDRVLKIATVHNLGPLRIADLIGLDYLVKVADSLAETSGDSRYRPAPLLRSYVDSRLLGRRTGRGFYLYPM